MVRNTPHFLVFLFFLRYYWDFLQIRQPSITVNIAYIFQPLSASQYRIVGDSERPWSHPGSSFKTPTLQNWISLYPFRLDAAYNCLYTVMTWCTVWALLPFVPNSTSVPFTWHHPHIILTVNDITVKQKTFRFSENATFFQSIYAALKFGPGFSRASLKGAVGWLFMRRYEPLGKSISIKIPIKSILFGSTTGKIFFPRDLPLRGFSWKTLTTITLRSLL